MARIIAAVIAETRDADGRSIEARQGQEVELTAEEEARLDAVGALVPTNFGSFQEFADYRQAAYRAGRGDPEAANSLAAARSGRIEDLSEPARSDRPDTAALAVTIREGKLNTDETVALAEGDPERAIQVLEAEETATDGNPRKSVVEELQRIIDGK